LYEHPFIWNNGILEGWNNGKSTLKDWKDGGLGKNFSSVLNPILQNSIIPIFRFLSNIPPFHYSNIP
jgi:hypothetical protein